MPRPLQAYAADDRAGVVPDVPAGVAPDRRITNLAAAAGLGFCCHCEFLLALGRLHRPDWPGFPAIPSNPCHSGQFLPVRSGRKCPKRTVPPKTEGSPRGPGFLLPFRDSAAVAQWKQNPKTVELPPTGETVRAGTRTGPTAWRQQKAEGQSARPSASGLKADVPPPVARVSPDGYFSASSPRNCRSTPAGASRFDRTSPPPRRSASVRAKVSTACATASDIWSSPRRLMFPRSSHFWW
jgi:hypothetical protein